MRTHVGYERALARVAAVVAVVAAAVGAPPATAAAPAADGFAGVTALGQGGTTGGAGGEVVTATTTAQFLDHIARPEPLVVQVRGTIALPTGTSDGMHDVASDKTIVGLGGDARLVGGGLNIGLPVDDDVISPPASAVHNVIIRNLSITGATDDLINVQMFNHHIWIDHNEFSNGDDGAVDIKRGSDFITVSWNRFHDHDKTLLLGHDDDNSAQDAGRLRVTYHHNYFDGTAQRHPRVRFGEPIHVYNNYYGANSDTGVACQNKSGCWVEGNYFENVEEPMTNSYAGPKGSFVERDNVYVNSGKPVVGGSVEDPRGYYAYTLDTPANGKALVTQGAGTGKI